MKAPKNEMTVTVPLADQGAMEADYNDQGGVEPRSDKAQTLKSDYAKLLDALHAVSRRFMQDKSIETPERYILLLAAGLIREGQLSAAHEMQSAVSQTLRGGEYDKTAIKLLHSEIVEDAARGLKHAMLRDHKTNVKGVIDRATQELNEKTPVVDNNTLHGANPQGIIIDDPLPVQSYPPKEAENTIDLPKNMEVTDEFLATVDYSNVAYWVGFLACPDTSSLRVHTLDIFDFDLSPQGGKFWRDALTMSDSGLVSFKFHEEYRDFLIALHAYGQRITMGIPTKPPRRIGGRWITLLDREDGQPLIKG